MTNCGHVCDRKPDVTYCISSNVIPQDKMFSIKASFILRLAIEKLKFSRQLNGLQASSCMLIDERVSNANSCSEMTTWLLFLQYFVFVHCWRYPMQIPYTPLSPGNGIRSLFKHLKTLITFQRQDNTSRHALNTSGKTNDDLSPDFVTFPLDILLRSVTWYSSLCRDQEMLKKF